MEANPIYVGAVSTVGWTISIIGILIACVIAWNVLGGSEDLGRWRDWWRRRRRSD